LEELRGFYKPIERKELDDHQKKYSMLKKSNDAETRRQQELQQAS